MYIRCKVQERPIQILGCVKEIEELADGCAKVHFIFQDVDGSTFKGWIDLRPEQSRLSFEVGRQMEWTVILQNMVVLRDIQPCFTHLKAHETWFDLWDEQ